MQLQLWLQLQFQRRLRLWLESSGDQGV